MQRTGTGGSAYSGIDCACVRKNESESWLERELGCLLGNDRKEVCSELGRERLVILSSMYFTERQIHIQDHNTIKNKSRKKVMIHIFKKSDGLE